jgi:hypothetical protein
MLSRSSERIEHINNDGETERSFFDLSTTGICCLFNRRLAVNSFVAVKINDLTLKARVVYCNERKDGFRLGLQFIGVAEEKQRMLNDWVERFSRGVGLTCAIIDAPGKGPS